MMNDLGRREMNELHVEAGAGLTGALLRSGLVDELLVYVAPVILGDSARGMFALPALESLEDAPRVRIVGVDRMGEDVRIIARLGVGNAAAR
jgi:diaminohydroxyphosphoribosylaminopyrimidine deaminase/5-amino-6-(5-phosphoribosylamino)uracil reductase